MPTVCSDVALSCRQLTVALRRTYNGYISPCCDSTKATGWRWPILHVDMTPSVPGEYIGLPCRQNIAGCPHHGNLCHSLISLAVFTLGPVLFRILANLMRRVDFASGLHSHYKRLTRRERYASTSPCTHCVCFATG